MAIGPHIPDTPARSAGTGSPLRAQQDGVPTPASETTEDRFGSGENVISLVQLSNDDFPGYFQERGRRLFPATGTYPLPVDGHEQAVREFSELYLPLD